MSPRWEFRLHIGAHKTATTHLQDSLAALSDAMRARGAAYLPRSEIRRSGLLRTVHGNACGAGRPLEAFLALPQGWPPRIVISEEDILGTSVQLLDGLYRHAARSLKPWAAATDPARTHVYLAIRNQADILPSAYSQALRDGAVIVPFAAWRQRWLADPPRWTGLVAAARALFPASPLTVWTAEHYARHAGAVLSAVAGCVLPPASQARPESTARLSAAAVDRLAALDPHITGKARFAAIREIIAAAAGGEPFDPLTPSDKARLSACYGEDLAAIRAMENVAFLG